jgi:5-methylcytosine-specific restriction endonuclease McrA
MGQTQTQELLELAAELESGLRREQSLTEEHRKLCYRVILAMKSAAPNVKNVRGARQILKEYRIEEVLPYIPMMGGEKEREYHVENNTFKVKMYSARYKMFFNNLSCVRCGVVGTFFKLERMTDGVTDRAHFNLYAVHPVTGEDVLMTKDHILPRSKGGKDKLPNYQTMCTFCNNDKGNELEADRVIHPAKFTDWVSSNDKWIVTIDRVTAYDESNPSAVKYSGRSIDLVTGRETGWTKLVDGSCSFQKTTLPRYVKKQVESIDV